jgi:hypothetical protein
MSTIWNILLAGAFAAIVLFAAIAYADVVFLGRPNALDNATASATPSPIVKTLPNGQVVPLGNYSTQRATPYPTTEPNTGGWPTWPYPGYYNATPTPYPPKPTPPLPILPTNLTHNATS